MGHSDFHQNEACLIPGQNSARLLAPNVTIFKSIKRNDMYVRDLVNGYFQQVLVQLQDVD